MSRSIVIIQARMGASRLPGKVLLPLGEHCLLDYSVKRCQNISGTADVVIATTVEPADNVVEAWCKERGIACFRGSEEDVLARFLGAAEPYKPEYIVRVTGDNPFIDYQLAGVMLESCQSSAADIVKLQGQCPLGLAAEVVSYDALHKMAEWGQEQRHREHVTYYAYEFPEKFASVEVPVPRELHEASYRLTVDTQEDYLVSQAIAAAFPGNLTVSSEEVIRFLRAHPEIAEWNASVSQKPVV